MEPYKKQKMTDNPCERYMLIVNGMGREIMVYHCSTGDAPDHMKEQMEKATSGVFEITEDNEEELDGLVDEKADELEALAEEVWEYLNAKCVQPNEFNPGVHKSIDYCITINAA